MEVYHYFSTNDFFGLLSRTPLWEELCITIAQTNHLKAQQSPIIHLPQHWDFCFYQNLNLDIAYDKYKVILLNPSIFDLYNKWLALKFIATLQKYMKEDKPIKSYYRGPNKLVKLLVSSIHIIINIFTNKTIKMTQLMIRSHFQHHLFCFFTF